MKADRTRAQEIAERAEKATPAPWREGTRNVWQDDLLICVAKTDRSVYENGTRVPKRNDCLEWEQADAQFIAHAREDVPYLLDRLATLGQDRETLRRLAMEATNGWACYAKRKIEHDEISRLHQAIRSTDAAAEKAQP